VLNLTEGFEFTLRRCLHYLGPALLASNSQLNKYGYERRFIDKSWGIKVKEIDCEILLLREAVMPHCERHDEIICFAKAGL